MNITKHLYYLLAGIFCTSQVIGILAALDRGIKAGELSQVDRYRVALYFAMLALAAAVFEILRLKGEFKSDQP